MSDLRVSTGYQPRTLQAKIHRALKRFNVLVCHRRFGKTVLSINELIDQALRCELPSPRYGYVAPFYKQAKGVAWDYLKQYTCAIPGMVPNESELRVDLPGDRRIRLYGADNPDALRGIYLDGLVCDEFAQMRARLWGEILRPILADRRGWAMFIGTPQGHDEFYQLYDQAKHGWWEGERGKSKRYTDPDWYAAMYKASETGVLPDEEIADMRRTMEDYEAEQELECSFDAAARGSYYAKLLADADEQGRITKVPYEPEARVWTCWDLGIGDSTAIWFVQSISGGEVHVIDYYEASGEGLQHYADLLDGWGKPVSRGGRGYLYSDHVAPHDIRHRELGTGLQRLETGRKLGLNFKVVAQHRVDDGIQAVRNLIPKCWFDVERCHKGLEALRLYRRDFDDTRGDFRDVPLHDWTSHAADALRYGAMFRPTGGDFNRKIDYGPGDQFV